MICKVLEDFPEAADSSRPGASIGEFRFDIQSDYPSPTPLQSKDCIMESRITKHRKLLSDVGDSGEELLSDVGERGEELLALLSVQRSHSSVNNCSP